MFLRNVLAMAIIATMTACSGGGGSGSDSPASNDQSTTPKKCRELRKEYVDRVVGANAKVPELMNYITSQSTADDFWRNLPDCYKRKAAK